MKRVIMISIVSAAVVGTGLLGVKALHIQATQTRSDALRSIRPDIVLNDLLGRSAHLRARDGTPTIVVFFTTHCEYCRIELEHVRTERDRMRGADVALISPQDADTLLRFAKLIGLDTIPHLRVLQDRDARLFRRFAIKRVPTTLIYAAEGELIDEFDGLTGVDRLVGRLEDLNR